MIEQEQERQRQEAAGDLAEDEPQDEFQDAADDEMRGAPDPRGLYVPPYEAPGMYVRPNDVGFPDVRVVHAHNNGRADWGTALGRLGVNPQGLSWHEIYEIYTADPDDPRIAGALPYLTGQAFIDGQPRPRAAAAPAQPAPRGAPVRGIVNRPRRNALQGGGADDSDTPITGLPATELTADATEAAQQAAEGLARPSENPAPEALAAPATDQAQAQEAPAPAQLAAATSAPATVSASAAAAAAQVRADLKPPAIQPLTSAAAREVIAKRAKASRAREEGVEEEVAAKRAKVVVVAARNAPAAAARALKLPSAPMALTTANAAPGAPYKAAIKNLTGRGGDGMSGPAEAPPPPTVQAATEEADSVTEVEPEDSAPAVQDEARGQAPTVQTEKENTPAWPQGTVLAPIFRRDETTPGTAVRKNVKTRVTTARPAVKGSGGEARVAPTKPAPQAKKTALEELLMG